MSVTRWIGAQFTWGTLLALAVAGCTKTEPESPATTKPAATPSVSVAHEPGQAAKPAERSAPAAPREAATPAPASPAAAAPSAAVGEFVLPDIDLSKLSPGVQIKIGDARYRARRSPEDISLAGRLGAMCFVYDLPDVALACFKRATQAAPTEPAWWYDLARTYEKMGDKAQAGAAYDKLLALKDYPPARTRLAELRGQPAPPAPASQPAGAGGPAPVAGDPLEKLLLRQGLDVQATVDAALELASVKDFQMATDTLKDALSVDETGVRSHSALGLVLSLQGQYEDAIKEFELALATPEGKDFAPAKANLASVLTSLGRYDRAIPILRELTTQSPDLPELANSLAWIYATSADASYRNPEEAVRLAEKANKLTDGGQHAVLDTLAAAYAAAGRFDDAKQTIAEAIRRAEAAKRPDAVSAYRERQRLYEAGKPFFEPRKRG